ncbi:hypothetical protein NLX83_33805 [Allokutzneria sp. A3M-2-11 16]|uniref:hypothetical protein n=1 Tax=Allokutzneria sp. A3M-2-11 16 TaxID=2962043 RepID=UPI0020B82491|nr:hypothetical protein [Allokutzneria sp. A3M-2-11 16]MCP3804260.1 hypothetical protein [Allokutzneria sp. A3M-2-11 16]
MPWNLIGSAGWVAAVLAATTVAKHLFLLLRHRISESSETRRFVTALRGSAPGERPAIIRAYSKLAKPGDADEPPAEGN